MKKEMNDEEMEEYILDELLELKEVGYFTCTDSECSCQEVEEDCNCSESECSCDEEYIDEDLLKELQKANRKLEKSSCKNDKCKDECKEKLELVFDEEPQCFLETCKPKSSLIKQEVSISSFQTIINQSTKKLETLANTSDNTKIELILRNLNNVFSKLDKKEKDQYQDQIDLLNLLYA